MTNDFDWSTDAVAHLRALWDEGHTTAEIGRRLGTTKNAVVGKAHRLRLIARPSPIRRDETARVRTPGSIRGPTLPPLATAASSTPPAPLPPRRAPVPPPIRTYAGPSGRPCCWPLGEPGQPGFRFCEAGTAPGRPYCPTHADVAYVRPTAARDRPDGARLSRYLRTLTQTA